VKTVVWGWWPKSENFVILFSILSITPDVLLVIVLFGECMVQDNMQYVCVTMQYSDNETVKPMTE